MKKNIRSSLRAFWQRLSTSSKAMLSVGMLLSLAAGIFLAGGGKIAEFRADILRPGMHLWSQASITIFAPNDEPTEGQCILTATARDSEGNVISEGESISVGAGENVDLTWRISSYGPTPVGCTSFRGDVNADGVLNNTDFIYLTNNFGNSVNIAGYCANLDEDANEIIGTTDIILLENILSQKGTLTPLPAAEQQVSGNQNGGTKSGVVVQNPTTFTFTPHSGGFPMSTCSAQVNIRPSCSLEVQSQELLDDGRNRVIIAWTTNNAATAHLQGEQIGAEDVDSGTQEFFIDQRTEFLLEAGGAGGNVQCRAQADLITPQGPTCTLAAESPIFANQTTLVQWAISDDVVRGEFSPALSENYNVLAVGQGTSLPISAETIFALTVYDAQDRSFTCTSNIVTLSDGPEFTLQKEVVQTPLDIRGADGIPVVRHGDVITYEIAYENIRTDLPASGIQIIDEYDQGYLTDVSTSPQGLCADPLPVTGSNGEARERIVCQVSEQSGVITVTAQVSTDEDIVHSGEIIENIARLTFTGGPAQGITDTARVRVGVPEVYAEKTATQTTLRHGEETTYRIFVQNNGEITLDIVLQDIFTRLSGINGDLSLVGDITLQTEGVNCPATVTAAQLEEGIICTDFSPASLSNGSGDSITITYTKRASTNTMAQGETASFGNRVRVFALSDTDTPLRETPEVVVTIGPDEVIPVLNVGLTPDEHDSCIGPNWLDGNGGIVNQSPARFSYQVNWSNDSIGNVDFGTTTLTVDCNDADGSEPNIRLEANGAQSLDQENNIITWQFDLGPGGSGTWDFIAFLEGDYGVNEDRTISCSATISSGATAQQTTEEFFIRESCRDYWDKRVVNLNDHPTAQPGDGWTRIDAHPGDELMYSLTYTADNGGESTYQFRDNVSQIIRYVDFVDFNSTDGSMAGTGRPRLVGEEIVWDEEFTNIAPNDSRTVTFRVRIKSVEELEQIGGNYRLFNAFGNDVTTIILPNLIRDKMVTRINGGEVTQNQGAADGSAITRSYRAFPGDEITYQLSVRNRATPDTENRVDGFIFREPLDGILDYVEKEADGRPRLYTPTDPDCSILEGTTILSCLPISVRPGETHSRQFTVRILDPLAVDEYTMRNAYGNVNTVISIPDLRIRKSVFNETTNAGCRDPFAQNTCGTSISADEGHTLIYTLAAQELNGVDFPQFSGFVDSLSEVIPYMAEDENNQPLIEFLGEGAEEGQYSQGVVRWNAVDVPANGTVQRSFRVTLDAQEDWPFDPDRIFVNTFGNEVTVELPEALRSPEIQVFKQVQRNGQGEYVTDIPSAIAGDTLTYRIGYSNTGTRSATGVILVDDVDESRVTIDPNSFVTTDPNVTCQYRDISEYTVSSLGGPMGIYCTVGLLLNNPNSQFVSYRVQIQDDASGDIFNAVVVRDQQTGDTLGDPTVVHIGEVSIAKTARDSSSNTDNDITVRGGGSILYTITVTNTRADTQDFVVEDILEPLNDDQGGTLTFEPSSLRFVSADPAAPLPQVGVINAGVDQNSNTQRFQVQNLQSGQSVTFSYRAQASDEGIDFNQVAGFTNVATIEGTQVNSGPVNAIIEGPTRNTGGGGGSGGGGGGSRIVDGSVILLIEKQVQDLAGTWYDADTFDLAALIPGEQVENFHYRISVTNQGNISAQVEIEDIFQGENITRLDMTDISGAQWNPQQQRFFIEELGAGKTATIAYTSVVEKLSASNAYVGQNTATLLHAAARADIPSNIRLRTLEGIGGSDSAFVRDGVPQPIATELVFTKIVNKKSVKPGEEFVYTLFVENGTAVDLKNMIVRDAFPFDTLEYLGGSVRGVQRAGNIEFRKNILRAGEKWPIRIRARVQSATRGGIVVRNVATLRADNADLSEYQAEVDITIDRLSRPTRLQSTGPEHWFVLFSFLGMLCLWAADKKRRQSVS